MTPAYSLKCQSGDRIDSIVDTLGGPGVTQLFVHSISLGNLTEIKAVLPGFENYVERALVAARPNDVVCLQEPADRDYLRFLRSLGMGPQDANIVVASRGVRSARAATLSDLLAADDEVLAAVGKMVNRDSQLVLNPYIASAKEFKLASRLEAVLGKKVRVLGGNPEIVDYANQKHNVRAKALELGVPVARGEIVELEVGQDGRALDLTLLEVAAGRHIGETGRVIVKGSYGTSGSSTFIVEDLQRSLRDALSIIAARVDNSVYVVEALLDITVSPNIQMHIEPEPGNLSCVGITDQCLGQDLKQSGSIYPSVCDSIGDMTASARTLSQWLQAEGYAGLAGFDFAEYQGARGRGYFLAEINPRANGATYPTFLMEHLNRKQKREGRPPIEAFLSIAMKTKARSFADLHKWYGRLFFDSRTGKGAIPYNIGCLKEGKFDAVVFGKDRVEVTAMRADLKTLAAGESS